MKLTLVALLVLVSLAACRSEAGAPTAPPPVLSPHPLGSLARLHSFGELHLASQPKAEDLSLLQSELDLRTVIDLRKPGENKEYDEPAAVAALGLAYVNLPIGGPADLTDEAFERARELLRQAERPLLLHCASANRVGAVWLAYRVLDGGLTLDAALDEAKMVGLKSAELEARAREYVAQRLR